MSAQRIRWTPAMMTCLVAAGGMLLFLGGLRTDAQELASPEAIAWDEEDADAEHLLSGPLHEAFAAPAPFDPEPGLVISTEPPAPINELPPDVRPEEGAIWIEGYWAWDDEREDFVWVSGVYRVPPVGRRWVPGYWQEVADGFQWVAGFWAPLEEEEMTYLPDPPATLERGPTSPPPSAEHFWVAGHWYYHDGRYVWRPGYWELGREGWVWVPAHYRWTPRGCVFTGGYWDYPFTDRGVVFAPVYWHRPLYLRSGFYYRPLRVIDLARLHLHLFVRPRYCHYYYGDWYGRPRGWGIYASFAFHGRFGYDPLWTYHRWYFGRRGIDYRARVRGWHQYFGRHADRRPPRTWRGQQEFARRHGDYPHLRHVVLGQDLGEFAARHPQKFTRTGEGERQRMLATTQAMREFRDARRAGERDRRPGGLRLPVTPDVRERRERTARIPADRRPPGTRWPDIRPERRPDVRRPDVRRPDVRRPDVRRPDVRRPDVRRPDVRRPDVRRPDVRRPDVRRPDVRRPDVRRPDVRRPDVRRPDVRRPDVRRPDVRRPDVRRPDVRRPDVRRPDVRRPDVRRSDVRRPEVRPERRPNVRRPDVRPERRPEIRRPTRSPEARPRVRSEARSSAQRKGRPQAGPGGRSPSRARRERGDRPDGRGRSRR
jgi:hypothetical protein